MINLFFNTCLNIGSLLGVRFIDNRVMDKYYIGKRVKRAFQCQAKGANDEFSWHLAGLIALDSDLSAVAKIQPKIIQQLRKKLLIQQQINRTLKWIFQID